MLDSILPLLTAIDVPDISPDFSAPFMAPLLSNSTFLPCSANSCSH